MQTYLNLLRDVISNGTKRVDRTGVGTRAVFGRQIRFNMAEGFPLLTTKRVHFKSVLLELLWFIAGSTDNNWLKDKGISIWDEWACEDGSLGPIYGSQWRSWPSERGPIDQLQAALETIRHRPHSRRILVNAWNVGFLPDESLSAQDNVQRGKMALPPCHCLFQFYVEDEKLSLQLYQRSADLFLGVPFNIASYSLLLHMVAHITNKIPHEFIHTFGDLHLYENHLTEDIVYKQLQRNPLELCKLEIKSRGQLKLEDFLEDDFVIKDYQHHGKISAPIAV